MVSSWRQKSARRNSRQRWRYTCAPCSAGPARAPSSRHGPAPGDTRGGTSRTSERSSHPRASGTPEQRVTKFHHRTTPPAGPPGSGGAPASSEGCGQRWSPSAHHPPLTADQGLPPNPPGCNPPARALCSSPRLWCGSGRGVAPRENRWHAERGREVRVEHLPRGVGGAETDDGPATGCAVTGPSDLCPLEGIKIGTSKSVDPLPGFLFVLRVGLVPRPLASRHAGEKSVTVLGLPTGQHLPPLLGGSLL